MSQSSDVPHQEDHIKTDVENPKKSEGGQSSTFTDTVNDEGEMSGNSLSNNKFTSINQNGVSQQENDEDDNEKKLKKEMISSTSNIKGNDDDGNNANQAIMKPLKSNNNKNNVENETKIRFKGSQPLTRTIRCSECGVDVALDEWPNHRDRLRKVVINEQRNNFQRSIVNAIMNFLMWILVNVYFREVAICGLENVPKQGPVLFYGNHQNQFIDALMIRAFCGRPVRFIIAEKSMHRPVVGQFARLTEAVPVIRPQDVPAVQGEGVIEKMEGQRVWGHGTSFATAVTRGDVLVWLVSGRKDRCTGQIQSIESDTVLSLTLPVADGDRISARTSYQISRRIDHSEMYASVYDTFAKGYCIGIFPEGSSHDRTSLQPLKAGVATFALGASERGISLTIVPVGLTYFYGHKFRSRAHVEFGEPIRLTDEMIEKFNENTKKREVAGEFLNQLNRALRAMTINVADWASLKFLHAFRRLYQPPNLLLDESDYLQLTRRLSHIIERQGNESVLMDFRERVENYNDYCAALLIRDSQAATLENLGSDNSFRLLLRRVVMIVVLAAVLIPFAVIAVPIGFITKIASEHHAKTALSASKVKVVAADVKGSFKLAIGFIAVPLVMNAVSLVAYLAAGPRIALTIFFALPMAMYVSLLILREFVLELRAALPLLISLISKHKQFKKLFMRRQALVHMAREMVQKYEPSLEEEIEQLKNVAEVYEIRKPSLFSLRHSSRIPRKKMQ